MAHTLNYQLHQLCVESRAGSASLKANRHKILQQMGRQLKNDGYKLPTPQSLKPKHVEHLLKTWQQQDLGAGTIKNRMSHLRWWANQIGKKGIIPRSNDKLGIERRTLIPKESKAQTLEGKDLAAMNNPRMEASLRLQEAFGLRREESLKIIPKMAHRGSQLVLKGSWCKGGRPRTLEIRTDVQKRALETAKSIAGSGSLIPPSLTYIQHLKRFEKAVGEAGVCKMHGLRHHYAQQRYQELTGRAAPVNGGEKRAALSPEQKILDTEARQIISRELGHERLSVVAQYIGS